ncbi:MAG: DUF1080 domain-containing protein [Verrucomicrobia bacterium]|nr:DUF1080 domain-containing protein [Verrucomicrobiota bacterium]
MKLRISILIGLGLLASAAQTGRAEGIQLFNGKDLNGWRQPAGEWQAVAAVAPDAAEPKKFVITPGTGVLVNGPKGRTSNLLSETGHGDVEAHVEFCVPKGSNSGVYFMARYEIQVFDSWGVEHPKYSDCGGIYQRWNDAEPDPAKRGYEGHAPRVNASKPPGEWQSFDVIFRAPRFDASGKKIKNACFVKVVHNGKVVHDNVEVSGPTRASTFNDEKPAGPLMLQGDHGPVAYRNLRIKKLK